MRLRQRAYNAGIIPAYAGNTESALKRLVIRGDHPRVCGEHSSRRSFFSVAEGSSPRMRGTHYRAVRAARPHGIIPAYAGNTKRWPRLMCIFRDHPRVCGEHPYRIIPIPEDMGSSPRMRGTHLHTFRESDYRGSSPRMRGTPVFPSQHLGGDGIIPAYAGNTSKHSILVSPKEDHPRVCGEHMSDQTMRGPSGGSSPRMRGTQYSLVHDVFSLGIIPAYAGNTRNPNPRKRPPRDHPRVCGEHLPPVIMDAKRRGSSPRMRGTLTCGILLLLMMGIIPAYAGNTRIVSFRFRKIWDHPRVCGEHSSSLSFFSVVEGSSPRMRGTRHVGGESWSDGGIIPAYAGNTFPRRAPRPSRRDHPRVCGEHTRILKTPVNNVGSSPRMRGTPATRIRPRNRIGIIPAYAGNTNWFDDGVLDDKDHPRVCGEHAIINGTEMLSKGSSPRMRGTQFPAHPDHRWSGIIPAYAGNTRTVNDGRIGQGDHPRVCGEHTGSKHVGLLYTGSSPRMRGTHLSKLRCYPFCGIIPAYAGNTSAC